MEVHDSITSKSWCTPAQHEWQCKDYWHTPARAPNKTLSFEVYAFHSLQVAKNKELLIKDPKTVKQVMCSVATVLHILVAGCSNSTFHLWCLGCPLSSLFYCQECKAFLFPQRATEDQNVFVPWIFSDSIFPGIKAVCCNIIATWPSMICITTTGSVCLLAIFITEEWLDSLTQQRCHITLHSK